MSGGSLNYLCYKEPNELINHISEMEEVERELINRNAQDIAKDVRRLIEYVLTAENRISVLQGQLNGVFHAIEWYQSGDYGDSSLEKALREYRNGGGK